MDRYDRMDLRLKLWQGEQSGGNLNELLGEMLRTLMAHRNQAAEDRSRLQALEQQMARVQEHQHWVPTLARPTQGPMEPEEAQPLVAETPSSSPDTTPTADIPSGESTSSETWLLVRVGYGGVSQTMATATPRASNSLRTVGGVLRSWLAIDSLQIAPLTWESPSPSGPTSPSPLSNGPYVGGQEVGKPVALSLATPKDAARYVELANEMQKIVKRADVVPFREERA